jgi:hypothetical protein
VSDTPHGIGSAHGRHRERVVVKQRDVRRSGHRAAHGDAGEPEGGGCFGERGVGRTDAHAGPGRFSQHIGELAELLPVGQADDPDLQFWQQPPR